MRAFEVMTEGVQTVPPTMPAADAWELMRRKRIHHLVVTLKSDVVGILSDRDTGSGVGAEVRALHTVGDLMTSQVVTVRANDTIRSVANVMRGRTIGCVPVVEGKRLVGILTVSAPPASRTRNRATGQAVASGGDASRPAPQASAGRWLVVVR